MEHNPNLTSSEIAALWGAYMENSMTYCVVQHMQSVNADPDIAKITQLALSNCEFVMNEVKRIFQLENHAVPIGFTEEDVNLKAKRVYSDIFALRYIKYMGAAGTAAASLLMGVLARDDIRELFSKISEIFLKLFNESCDLLLKKGVLVRSPTIPPMEKAEYIHSESFLSGLIGTHRPLTAVELAHISKNTETNSIGRTFVSGLSQTALSPDVRKYMERGAEIALKQEAVFRDLLQKEGVPMPSTWDSTISKSIDAPFSDKLMMSHVMNLSAVSVGGYGVAMGLSLRKDLVGHYTSLMAEIMQYASDGTKLMIENNWLEQPPQNVDREALRNRSN